MSEAEGGSPWLPVSGSHIGVLMESRLLPSIGQHDDGLTHRFENSASDTYLLLSSRELCKERD